MMRFTVQPIYIQRKIPQYLLNGPQRRFVCSDSKEKLKRL